MSVGDICNHNPVIIGKSDSIYRAAELMRDNEVSNIIVVESRQGKNIPVGIIMERDIVVNLVATRQDLDTVTIADVVRPDFLVANENDHILQTVKRMRHNNMCCLAVVNDDDALIGTLSIDDILDKLSELLHDIGHIQTRQHAFSTIQKVVNRN